MSHPIPQPGGHGPGGRFQQAHLDPQGPQAITATTGTLKNLVLLVRFANHGPSDQNRILPTNADYSTMMNAVGGDPLLAPDGSVKDYYLENSYGQLTIESTVVGWLTVSQSEMFYADGVSGLSDKTMPALISEALTLADPLVDFSEFDADGDGWIDAITILHSGYGAEWIDTDMYGTAFTDRIWSHKWSISPWTSAEGVQVSDYNISTGLWDTVDFDIGRIGVIVHELGHFLGIPDLYDTGSGGPGVGMWGVMGAGAWGYEWNQTPSHMCAWTKMKLGWVEPQKILPGTYTALEVETNPSVFMIDSGYRPGEYLLIENRQPTGFDADIYQGGLAIWHIDEGKGSLYWNDVNADAGYAGMPGWPANNKHYRIALLQADGAFDLEMSTNPGDEFDLYHAGGVAEIDATTTPNTDGYQSGVVIQNMNRIEAIGPSAASISFTYVNTAAPTVTEMSLPNATAGLPYAETLAATGGTTPYTWSEYIEDPSYTMVDLGPQPFAMDGIPYNWEANEQTWAFTLPFVFPFFDQAQRRVYLTPNGTLDLAPLYNEYYNTHNYLRTLPRIAGLWDDLRTNGSPGADIYITIQPDSVRYRWEAYTVSSATPVNTAITLNADGRIRFDYGVGNTSLTPTVGMSRGYAGDVLLVDTHDGEEALTVANSIEFVLAGSQLPPGLSISPNGVVNGGPTAPGLYEFQVRVQDLRYRYDYGLISILVKSPTLDPVAVSPVRPSLTGSFHAH